MDKKTRTDNLDRGASGSVIPESDVTSESVVSGTTDSEAIVHQIEQLNETRSPLPTPPSMDQLNETRSPLPTPPSMDQLNETRSPLPTPPSMDQLNETRCPLPTPPSDPTYLDDWNPLKYDYESSQNLLLLDLDTEPLGFHLGITGQGVKSLANTHCRFYSGHGTHCWKGTHCMYKHEEGVSGTDFSEQMKFGKEPCNTITSLDNKRRLPDGISFYAQITHIVSPTEFFVLPSKGVECLCESLMHSHERDTHLEQKAKDQLDGDFKNDMAKVQEEMDLLEGIHYPPRQEGSEEYFKIREKLNEVLFDNSLWRRQQSQNYIPGELVAVKVDGPSEKLIWWRAETMECDVYDTAVERDLPWFKVRLIDVGTEQIVRADAMCKLPRAFCHIPALVYKCGLDAIVPVRMKWHKGAIEFFKAKVIDKDLLVTVIEQTPPEGMIKTIECVPYKVEVGVFGLQGCPITNVAQEMGDLGLGIPVNIFCERPKLNQFFTAQQMRLIGHSGRPEAVQSTAEEVQTIERERLKRILIAATGKKNEVDDVSSENILSTAAASSHRRIEEKIEEESVRELFEEHRIEENSKEEVEDLPNV